MLGDLLLPFRKISLIGMAKNTGKTTALNYLIEDFHKRGIALTLTGVGRDGEHTDVATGTDKPRIYVPRGTVVATAEGLLPFCDITKEVLAVTDIPTPLGRVVVVRARSGGYVQIGGPSVNERLFELIETLPGDKLIIDGAVSRKTQLYNADAVVLCTGAAYSPGMEKTIADTRHQVKMLTLPGFKEAGPGAAADGPCLILPGAVTDATLEGIPEGATLVAEDPGKLFITPAAYGKLLAKKITLYVKNPATLAAVTVNPTSPYDGGYPRETFLAKMREAVAVPVLDVKGVGDV